MYCPKCGAYNDNENIWCVCCGHGKLPIVSETEDKSKKDIYRMFDGSEKVDCTDCEINQNNERIRVGVSGCQWKVEKNEAKDYLVLAVISAVFGSVIFGVAAIIFSAMTKNENEAGNYDKAKDYSSKTKLFSIIALIVGASKYIFAIALSALFISGSFFYLF